jgi:transposase
MPNTRCPMRHVRDVMRLKFDCKMGKRPIAKSLGISRNTISLILARFQKAGLLWPLPPQMTDEKLENLLFPISPPESPKPLPDWKVVHQELQDHKRLNLTLNQLWIEYKANHPDGYQYSAFCQFYNDWLSRRDLVMRQSHKAGDKVFVDYADGLFITHPQTGEKTLTQLFVTVWGASTFTYAEASSSQTLPDWIGAHTRAFTYFGVVPRLLVPDNLKSGVVKSCLYEPTLNASYQDMADHYGTAVLPARPRKPRDKAKVENGVLIAKRWILSVLRHRLFYSLADMNVAIRQLLDQINDRPLRKIKSSRRQLFNQMDRPAALPLPARPYEFAEWKRAKVTIDYHIDIDSHAYSVPYQLVGEFVDTKLTATTVEILFKGQRIVAHPRSTLKGGHTTTPAHRPIDHQKHAEWSPSRLRDWAVQIGPHTVTLIQALFDSKAHPDQGYRSVLGIMRLEKSVGKNRLEAATERALTYRLTSYSSVRSILRNNLDQLPLRPPDTLAMPLHDNIRGQNYYASSPPVQTPTEVSPAA